MAIKAFGGGQDFENCPTGTHPAIACDVVDLGEVETPFKVEKGPKAGQAKIQHQIAIVWQVEAEDEDGNPSRRDDGQRHRLTKYYNLSLNEKATLRMDLDRWRGVAFTDEELKEGWDVESVIGAQCNLLVQENEKGKVLVDTVLPRHKRDPKLELEEYTREKDRPGGRDVRSPKAEGESGSKPAAKQQDDDDDDGDFDLPF